MGSESDEAAKGGYVVMPGQVVIRSMTPLRRS
jgi:hypothetical protein